MSPPENATLKTLYWFDAFDFPLTAWEIYKYLYYSHAESRDASGQAHSGSNTRSRNEFGMTETDFKEIIQALDTLKSSHQIQTHEGFYFLSGRSELVKIRKRRYILAEAKYKKALRVSKVLKKIPWIKLISVCNTLGYSNASENSDIDLFIICEPKRVWITRFFAISFLKFFGLRPLLAWSGKYPEKRRDRIDANFFLSEEHLDIQNLSIKKNGHPEFISGSNQTLKQVQSDKNLDIYLIYWILLQTPIYNLDKTYEKFIGANDWVRKTIPNFLAYKANHRRTITANPSMARNIAKKMALNIDERFYRWLQLKILPQHLKNQMNQSTNIVVNDQILKFHDKDRREYYRDRWLQNLNI